MNIYNSDRTSCVVCSDNIGEILHEFSGFPLYMGISEDEYGSDIHADMCWNICPSCGCVQLNKLLRSDILYAKSHNPAFGSTWEKHHLQFSEFSDKYCGKSILELGGANFKFARLIMDSNAGINTYTVCDPNTTTSDHPKIRVFNAFLEDCVGMSTDTVIHSHTMEHFYEPRSALRIIHNIILDEGHMIMSVPLIDKMLMDGFANGLNFEHTYLTTMEYISFMLNAEGFEIVDQKMFNNYNVFLACKKIKSQTDLSLPKNYSLHKEMFLEFVKNQQQVSENFHRIISCHDGPAFLFGAHIFSQVLLNSGMRESSIEFILDNDPMKIGRRLYGTDLSVKSPDILGTYKNPLVVLRVAQYRNEIYNQLIRINSNVIVEE